RFGRGVEVSRGDRVVQLVDPTRSPRAVAGMFRSGLLSPRATAALAGWVGAGLRSAWGGPDQGLADSWDAAGFTGPLRQQVVEPFLTGVLADDEGTTSAAFARRLIGWFLRGTPALPAQGMAALPAQLLAGLDCRVRLGAPVERIERSAGGWTYVVGGMTRLARAVINATDPVTAARLAGVPRPRMRGLATWWFAPEESPTDSGYLRVDADRRGPVINAAMISNVQASYAPAGRHLLQASTLIRRGEPQREADVRRHLGLLYGGAAASWTLVTSQQIPEALPAILPGRVQPEASAGPGMVVASDVREGSIQGALASGQKAANRIAAWLAMP
ncbi:MAG: FAD-dependent oxidoreductase, partial [Propioniciclava sp.]